MRLTVLCRRMEGGGLQHDLAGAQALCRLQGWDVGMLGCWDVWEGKWASGRDEMIFFNRVVSWPLHSWPLRRGSLGVAVGADVWWHHLDQLTNTRETKQAPDCCSTGRNTALSESVYARLCIVH